MEKIHTKNTILDVKNWGKNVLRDAGISNYYNEINWYLKEIKKTQTLNDCDDLSQSEIFMFKSFIKKRSNNTPFQYLIKKAPFYKEDFFVNKDVLIPRPETELIVRILNDKQQFFNAIDIGTGSGNLAITLRLNNSVKQIMGTDISKEAIKVANKNAANLNVSNVSFMHHDFLTENLTQKYDLIVSNPPYISTKEYAGLDLHIKNFEPQIALTDNGDGLSFYRHFATNIKNILLPKGTMLLEIGYESNKDTIQSFFNDINCQIKWHKDYNNNYRVIEIYNE